MMSIALQKTKVMRIIRENFDPIIPTENVRWYGDKMRIFMRKGIMGDEIQLICELMNILREDGFLKVWDEDFKLHSIRGRIVVKVKIKIP